MIYGKSKARNMGRSLLPSTRAKSARDDKAAVKRTTRHHIRRELHRVTIDPEYYEDAPTDFDTYPDHEIREVVYERRGGDKTAPFERWAEAVTKKIDQDSRLTHVKSLLPDGIIGDHALSHIEWREHFASRAKLQLRENERLNALDRRNKDALKKEDALKLLYKVIENSQLHRALNNFMTIHVRHRRPYENIREEVFNELTQRWTTQWRSVYYPLPPGVKLAYSRKLLGIHDIETYYDDVVNGWREKSLVVIDGKKYANPRAFDGSYQALNSFLKAVRDHKPIPRELSPYPLYY